MRAEAAAPAFDLLREPKGGRRFIHTVTRLADAVRHCQCVGRVLQQDRHLPLVQFQARAPRHGFHHAAGRGIHVGLGFKHADINNRRFGIGLQRRAARVPVGCLLIRMPGRQQLRVVNGAGDELQPQRQGVFGKAAAQNQRPLRPASHARAC